MVRIGIIGAGSANYALSIVKDLCLTPSLRGAQLCFMDIDPYKLDIAYRLCVRYAAELGVSFSLSKTTSRKECLRGADFVIHTALAGGGGHPRLQEGWRIAKRHGYRHAGSLHVMHDEAFWVNFHQLKLMDSIARDILRTCPKAMLLLVANPVFAGTTWLMRAYPRLKMVGLCHGYSGVFGIANALGLKDHSKLRYEVAGVNHFLWLTRMSYRGRDVFPILDRWVKRGAYRARWARWRRRGAVVDEELNPVKLDLYRTLGAVPVGDAAHCCGGAWPYWFRADAATERKWRVDAARWWRGHFRFCRNEIGRLERILRDRRTKLTDRFGAERTGEPLLRLVDSIVRDVPRRIVVNTLNAGNWVPGIPKDIAVELPVKADGRGVHGIPTKRLPAGVLAWITRDLVAQVEMELAAYREGSRNLLLNLILMDPMSRTKVQAERFMNEILSRHPEMRRHYR